MVGFGPGLGRFSGGFDPESKISAPRGGYTPTPNPGERPKNLKNNFEPAKPAEQIHVILMAYGNGLRPVVGATLGIGADFVAEGLGLRRSAA